MIGDYLQQRRDDRAATFGEAVDKFRERERQRRAWWEAGLVRPEPAAGDTPAEEDGDAAD